MCVHVHVYMCMSVVCECLWSYMYMSCLWECMLAQCGLVSVCACRHMPVGDCVYIRCDQMGQAHWVSASKEQLLGKYFNYTNLMEEPGGV